MLLQFRKCLHFIKQTNETFADKYFHVKFQLLLLLLKRFLFNEWNYRSIKSNLTNLTWKFLSVFPLHIFSISSVVTHVLYSIAYEINESKYSETNKKMKFNFLIFSKNKNAMNLKLCKMFKRKRIDIIVDLICFLDNIISILSVIEQQRKGKRKNYTRICLTKQFNVASGFS